MWAFGKSSTLWAGVAGAGQYSLTSLQDSDLGTGDLAEPQELNSYLTFSSFQALQSCFCLFSLSEFPKKTVPQWSSYLFLKCGLIALRETLMEHSPALKPPSSTASHLYRINYMCRKWVLCYYMGKNDPGRGRIPLSKHKHYKLCGLYVGKECKFESSSSHLRWVG